MAPWWILRRENETPLSKLHHVWPRTIAGGARTFCGMRVLAAERLDEEKEYLHDWCQRCDRIERASARAESRSGT